MKLAYRAVLHREADPDGLKHYTGLLDAGELEPATLLEALLNSAEARGGATDHGLTERAQRFLSPDVLALSERLQAECPIPLARFDEESAQAVPHMGRLGFTDQREYLTYHRARFHELDNIAATLLKGTPTPRVLDAGMSINSLALSRLLPQAKMAVCDRPFFKTEGQPFDFYDVDLTDPDLDRKTLPQRFDLIVFSEVIEHLLANPVRVLGFFVRHLNARGHLIVTTPNFFSGSNLRALGRLENPQPVFPPHLKRGQEVEFHVREYSMSELLLFAEEAGGTPAAFFYSACWDDPAARLPPEHRGNLCAVIRRA